MEVSAEILGGPAETVENFEAKFFIWGWEKIIVQKTNLIYQVNIQSENMT